MSVELVQSTAQTYLSSHTDKIKKSINNIAHEFIYIGMLLWEINHHKWYLEDGYSSIVEYSEKVLNFKKRSTYNFIAIVETYSEWRNNYPTMHLDPKYKEYGYTQLCEMLSLAPEARESINPNMTIKEIREFKTDINNIVKPVNFIEAEYNEAQNNLKNNQVILSLDINNNDNLKIQNLFNDDELSIILWLVKNENQNADFLMGASDFSLTQKQIIKKRYDLTSSIINKLKDKCINEFIV